jgi:hypothetical protein
MLADQSESRILIQFVWFVDQHQIRGGNFELISHVTNSIPCKDSSRTCGLGQGTIALRRTHNVRLYACTQVPWCVRRYKVPSIDEHLHFDAKFVILYFAEGLGCIRVSGGRRWHNFLNLLHQICTAYVYFVPWFNIWWLSWVKIQTQDQCVIHYLLLTII